MKSARERRDKTMRKVIDKLYLDSIIFKSNGITDSAINELDGFF